MITVQVKVMGELIQIVGGSSFQVTLEEGADINDLLTKVFDEYGEEMRREVMNETADDLAPYYKILVNGRNSKLMEYFNTQLQNGDLVHIMPPIAGG